MSNVTRFLFIQFDAEITVDFRPGASPILLEKDSLHLVLSKAGLSPDLLARTERLLLWLFDEKRAGSHTRIVETKVQSVYIPDATRYTFVCPKYLMIRYVGTQFPRTKIIAERNVTTDVEQEIQSIFRAKFNPIQMGEISHAVAVELLNENPGYLLPETYHENGKKGK
ncbi:M protein [Maize yellow striate virus]|uniref:M protein n=1 Tax=Maize yellow striate virus TaxID=1168550 RepID=A0A2D1GTP4_9RHAB|nr:M protein [Maize yellow striate virus]ATN96440.1 M protein [Maize yellow striate virus]ATN96450.1 matrix protein [Maize yellow striate virus]